MRKSAIALALYIQADEQRCRIRLRGALRSLEVALHLRTRVIEETHRHSGCLSQVPDAARMALLVPTEEMVMLSTMGRDQAPPRTPYTPLLFFRSVSYKALIYPVWLLAGMRGVILS